MKKLQVCLKKLIEIMPKIIKFSEVNPISNKQKININNEINLIVKKRDFILGDAVSRFEKSFSKLSKIKYSVGCASGTDALLLSLMVLNLKKNDEIIVPSMTYISTGLSVILNNNKIVFADVDKNTGLISIDNIVKKITKKTKVIIPVNLYGQKVNLEKIKKKIPKKVFIIEDSAQSHFAYSCHYCNNNGREMCCKKMRNENFADISCYSFFPAKNLGAYGDGGMVCSNNIQFYRRLLSLRNLGAVEKNNHKFIGLNSRLDTIQAVVLKNKLKMILKLNDQRRKIANIYDKLLMNIKQIKLTKTDPGSTRHLYVIRTKNRNQLIKYLKKRNIYCQIHYPYSLNKVNYFKNNTRLKNSESWARECVSLPIHPYLTTRDTLRVVNGIKEFFNS